MRLEVLGSVPRVLVMPPTDSGLGGGYTAAAKHASESESKQGDIRPSNGEPGAASHSV